MAATLLLLAALHTESLAQKTYFVKAVPDLAWDEAGVEHVGGDGSSWDKAMSLKDALAKAQAGDKIYVKGYEHTRVDGKLFVYSLDVSDKANFYTLPSGVQLYGGFRGDETGINIENNDTRAYKGKHQARTEYRSVLVADRLSNDTIDNTLLIYPENPTRQDNSERVLYVDLGTPNTNRTKTVISGFTIAGGNATSKNQTDSHPYGGGIYITDSGKTGNAFEVSHCFFINNYAERGGAIYVDGNVTGADAKDQTGTDNEIKYCELFDNIGGTRGSSLNAGGGMWVEGAAKIFNNVIYNNVNGAMRVSDKAVVVNNTVTSNTAAAIDMVDPQKQSAKAQIYNTVCWGNDKLSRHSPYPVFRYCAIYHSESTGDSDGDNHNILISHKNSTEWIDGREEHAPYFVKPTTRVGYDRTYAFRSETYPSWNWNIEQLSDLRNNGLARNQKTKTGGYALVGGMKDVAVNGVTRTHTTDNANYSIEIGAFAYEELAAGRRLYVTQNGAGKKDGSSWGNAYAANDLQTAITTLGKNVAEKGRGEVWVAKGTYTPQTYVGGSSNTKSPLAFRMYEGVDVYGGFAGTEKLLSEREMANTDNAHMVRPWRFLNQTVFAANEFDRANTKWDDINKVWSVSSASYHVVWFAPLPGAADFAVETRLNGVIIEGGSSTALTDPDEAFEPKKGTGVYMGANAILQNCIVRYCYNKGNGAGVYASKGAEVASSLIYNNVSEENGGGIYVEDDALIMRTMVANNMANNGGGIYMHHNPTSASHPYDMEVVASVVSNNTNRVNGAVYTDGGGVITQCTITNNYTVSASDIADQKSARTGGLYVDAYALVVNSVLWNNNLKQAATSTAATTSSYAQVYAVNASADNVRFYNCGIISSNYVVWNNIFQKSTYNLSIDLAKDYFVDPTGKTNFTNLDSLVTQNGLQSTWTDIDYFWRTRDALAFHAKGLPVGLQPAHVVTKADLDIIGQAFDTTPAIGAYVSKASSIVPVIINRNDQKVLRVYVDPTASIVDGDGSTWKNNHSQFGEVLSFFGNLKNGQTIRCLVEGTDTYVNHTVSNVNSDNTGKSDFFEMCVREGNIIPDYAYTASDERDYSVRIPRTICPLTILGGYPSYSTVAEPSDSDRHPNTYRSVMTGELGDLMTLEGNVYHVMRVEDEASPVIDGFTIQKGYAAGSAMMPRGGGVLIGTDCDATFINCIFENNTAIYGGAIATTANAEGTNVILTNCVVNNNTCAKPDASYIPAASEQEYSRHPYIINIVDRNGNILALTHVSIVNNIGLPPSAKYLGSTSFAAGNEYDDEQYKDQLANNVSLATAGVEGAKNFANPTNVIGAQPVGNVFYGGQSLFRPLTGTAATDCIVNKAPVVSDGTAIGDKEFTNPATDLEGEPRDLGGAPDLGALEALLPKKGSVIYVRSYNTEKPENGAAKDETDGAPDFSLLKEHPGTEDGEYAFDGSSWDHAIMGNAVCDTMRLEEASNEIYVLASDRTLMSASYDNEAYSMYKSPDNWTWKDGEELKPIYNKPYYGPASGHYSYFIANGFLRYYFKGYNGKAPSPNTYWDVYQGNTNYVDKSAKKNAYFNCINNERRERYVSGLQFAVEKAARHNALHKNDPDFEPVEVWVGSGVYTDAKGFVIRNGVKVYGGFPAEGNPSKDDRLPLLSQYIPARDKYKNKKKSDYETILQVRKENPVYRTNTTDELWYSEGVTKYGSTNSLSKDLINTKKTYRHYVLYQPDACVPTWNVFGNGNGSMNGNSYRFLKNNASHPYYADYEGDAVNAPYNKPVYDLYDAGTVKWDGFTVRHGYIINYLANRDGGAGVRVFENVELENLVVVNNLTHGQRSRGGGLYMDGQNSKISNSFILNNFNTNSGTPVTNIASVPEDTYISSVNNDYGGVDQYGGGAYMIVGTGYNMVVAKNRVFSANGAGGGGGLFLENATFYNNTVAYNQTNGGASGIQQWSTPSTGIPTSLALYNCIVYGNNNGQNYQVTSTSPGNFKKAHNCYVQNYESNLNNQLSSAYGNITSSVNPFADGDNVAKTLNFRLAYGSLCLNAGTENLMQNGETKQADLPLTDMDFTDRIKDCTVDIGAYEDDNSANVDYDASQKGLIVYYVTETGYGNRSGSSPANAACADKLQSVLTAAGREAAKDANKDKKVIVKVAGYEPDKNGMTFVYQANTLADPTDPRSYTFLIPSGVTLKGGFNEGVKKTVSEGTVTHTVFEGSNWDTEYPDSYHRRTMLSAQAKTTATDTEVSGYHTVTFGSWPTDDLEAWNDTAVADWAMIDGCYITGGYANESDGHKALGGGVLVPRNAHVRNCVVAFNEAQYGGGIYALPGAVVSTSFVTENQAYYGAGIYADNGNTEDGTDGKRSYFFSNTIASNTASVEGGGISFESGAAILFNDVIWGNNAPSEKNVCGITDRKYKETKMSEVAAQNAIMGYIDGFYPFNNCFVETYLLAANTYNTEMSADTLRYFSASGSFVPRELGPLVHAGMENFLWSVLVQGGFAANDMLGNVMIMASRTNKLTAGCFAVHVLDPADDKLPTTLFTRLFVSDRGGVEVKPEEVREYMGRSFYTPFSSLDAALEYIRKVRTVKVYDSAKKDSVLLANDNTHFDVFIIGGTFYPTLTRTSALAQKENVRNNSFVIPCNTNLYGGFSPTDKYSCSIDKVTKKDGTELKLDSLSSIDEILRLRNAATEMEDLNRNGLYEPWELSRQTVLSGNLPNVQGGKKAFHVIFCVNYEDKKVPGVVLDGLTITDGETADHIDYDKNGVEMHNEIGHGGGIFSYGVDMTLNRCRVINNTGIHGGGIFNGGANMTILNSLVAGNSTQSNATRPEDTGKGAGVGIFFDSWKKVAPCRFVAVNTIFANNSCDEGSGGAVYVASGTRDVHQVKFMNCLFARNKAKDSPDIFNGKKGSIVATNSIFWGSKVGEGGASFKASDADHCASDIFTNIKSTDAHANLYLNADNEAVTGPHFAKPSEIAGKEGFTLASQWNPTCITVLTDAGDGKIDCDEKGAEVSEEGAYMDVWTSANDEAKDLYKDKDRTIDPYHDQYIKKNASATQTAGDDTGNNLYNRYMGPKRNNGVQDDKTIDIGPYEYQYRLNFGDLDKMYIGTVDRGLADGTNWDNQSSDLRGALLAAANPSSSSVATRTTRTVYVRSGEYYAVPIDGTVFSVNVDETSENRHKVARVVLKGACTGVGLGDEAVQDWTKPTVLKPHPVRKSSVLLNIETGEKPVDISGISLRNTYDGGKGATLTVEKTAKITIRQSEARINKGTAVDIAANGNGGEVLIYNTLFADNDADALKANGKTTVVNCTFAQNTNGADIAFAEGTDRTQTKVYNSASWANKTTDPTVFVSDLDNEDATKHTLYNKVFAKGQANNDLTDGPCFVDVTNTNRELRDYHITPGMRLFERGSLRRYAENVKTGVTDETPDKAVRDSVEQDRDLGNIKRAVGKTIEVGAYECNAELLPIIFVKDYGTDGTGKSWDDPKTDLQVAVDLAGMYSNLNNRAKSYVFVDHQYGHNAEPADLNVTLPDVSVYGSMTNNPTASAKDSTSTETIANAILAQRMGMVEEGNWRSIVKNLNVSSASVVDGVEVSKDGSVNLTNRATLSTSVVLAKQGVTGDNTSLLYNTLLYADPNATDDKDEGKTVGSVKNVRAVNVTTCGTMDHLAAGSDNNRIMTIADGANRYIVSRYRNCQLNEDDGTNLDPKSSHNEVTEECIRKVGHDRDLLGNNRLRNNVDNGCYETWNITADRSHVTAGDYPRPSSVVYVRKECELAVQPGLYPMGGLSWFNPGFVLLEHHAGLRGNDNQIGLVRYAVERDLKAQMPQLVALPFSVQSYVPAVKGNYTIRTYDGDTRSRYTYKYSDVNGDAWKESTGAPVGTGMMLEAAKDMTVRFYGGSLLGKTGFFNTVSPAATDYVENGGTEIVLTQYNHQDSWTSSSASGNRFTHKENMGWNLFGSPRLCATNLSDMEYGRIVYSYENGGFKARSTDLTAEGVSDAYIPSMDALFTQTATLAKDNKEKVAVSYRDQSHAAASFYGQTARMAVAITGADTRSADDEADEMVFNAVSPEYSHDYFDLGTDGVKWMERDKAQVYAVRDGARYSLLSAVNEQGAVALGVSLPSAGMYALDVPEGCDRDGYEAVLLKDNATGRAVDLLEGAYTFAAAEAGEQNTRFSISFHKLTETSGVVVKKVAARRVSITGLQEADDVRIYLPNGMIANQQRATSDSLTMSTGTEGVVIVEVTRKGTQVCVKRVAL